MAHTPLEMSIEEAHAEVHIGWESSYSPDAINEVQAAGLSNQHTAFAAMFQGNLLSADGEVRVAKGDYGKPTNDFQTNS